MKLRFVLAYFLLKMAYIALIVLVPRQKMNYYILHSKNDDIFKSINLCHTKRKRSIREIEIVILINELKFSNKINDNCNTLILDRNALILLCDREH